MTSNCLLTSAMETRWIVSGSPCQRKLWSPINVILSINFLKRNSQYTHVISHFWHILVCRHTEATTPNGTIQPIARNNTGPSKNCFFTIRAPYEHQIQISCPVVNLTDLTSYFEVSQHTYNLHVTFAWFLKLQYDPSRKVSVFKITFDFLRYL